MRTLHAQGRFEQWETLRLGPQPKVSGARHSQWARDNLKEAQSPQWLTQILNGASNRYDTLSINDC